jgi:dienelactone hydrolase
MMGSLVVEVSPPDALVDEPVTIRVRGAKKGAIVELVTRMSDRFEAVWESRAKFRADGSGTVDTARDAPMAGGWTERDEGGPFWSMEQTAPPSSAALLHELRASETITVEASSEERGAEATLVRRWIGPGVRVENVDADGLVGRLFHPESSRPLPGVLALTGSGGGFALETAALLASRGYAALAVGYFGVPGRPTGLELTPLEYLEGGIEWLASRRDVRGDTVAVVGSSKGGELALLLGATFRRVRAVVAWVPSVFVHPWFDAHGKLVSSWTYRGESYPFAAFDPSRNKRDVSPLSLRPGYEAALEDEEQAARAAIPIERTQGPIMMISGGADAMWPSSRFADLGIRRLRERGFVHRAEHLSYGDAGHHIGVPNLPTTRPPGLALALGGSPAATAHASRASWGAALDFLRDADSEEGSRRPTSGCS